MTFLKRLSVLVVLCTVITGCGGGGGSEGGESPETPTPPPATSTNNPPVINVVSSVTSEENTNIQIDASGSTDSDGTITQFRWRQLSGVSLSLQSTDSPIVSFTTPEVNTDQIALIELTITDNDNASTSRQVSVTIENTNLMQPQVNLQRNGNQVQVSWNDANASSYRVLYWQEGSRPNERSTSGNSLSLDNLSSGTYNILVEAYDELGNSIFSVPSQIGV